MRTRRLMATTAVGVMAGLASFGAGAGASPGPSVHGSGTVTLPAEFGELAGDPVVFTLQARGSGATASGRFNIVHRDDAGGLYAHLVGDVTCTSIADGVAVTTGIIRHAWFRDFPGSLVVGTAVAITVADDGAGDEVGFDFEFFEEDSNIAPCTRVEPFAPVERGDFTVR